MRTSPRSLALVLTSLLLVSLAPAFPVAAEDEVGRSTGNEEVSFQPLSSKYYDRGGDITFTVTAKNLDPNTEYTLDWEICNTGSSYDYDCEYSYGDSIGGSGSIDLGSGNMLSLTTITYTDPGVPYENYDSVANEWVYHAGVENNSLVFSAELNVQGVPLDTNTSEPFVMGGDLMDQYSQLYEVSNILKNTDVDLNGYFYLDHDNRRVLNYTVNCHLYEDGTTTPVDSVSVDAWPYYEDFHFSIPVYDEQTGTLVDELVPTATSGDHYVECELVRDIDNGLVGTLTTNTFEVIDADITGNEEVSFQSMSSKYYDRTDDSTTTTITFDIDTEHLYVGTEYTVDWRICNTGSSYDYDCEYSYGDSIGGSGEITFTATASGTHTETITYTDPGVPYETYDSVANEWVYMTGSGTIRWSSALN